MITIAQVSLPDFGCETIQPQIPIEVYQSRLDAVIRHLASRELDQLVVFADREHFANLAYLTGLDPRFEEAMLLLDASGKNLLLVGNECMGYLPDERLGLNVQLFQDFSLMGQQRDNSRPLREILSNFGIGRGSRIGCVGWKVYDGKLVGDARLATDLPSYLVDLLRDLTGDARSVSNATGLFTDPADGLRIINIEPAQIACFEYAAVQTSRSVLAVMRHIKPGVAEDELEGFLCSAGLPLSCHRMVSFGAKAQRGLSSPTSNVARSGDAFTTAIGVIGSLTARAGVIAESAKELPPNLRDFYPRFAANYFDVVTAWYEKLRTGVTAGAIVKDVQAKRDDALFNFAVNPGHYIHLEEWTHSSFYPGSNVEMQSGMALQMDIIPMSKGPICCSNVEDGVVLADAKLRATLAEKFPNCWQRMQARRQFMEKSVGIHLHESVLPMSNMPAYLPPFVLATSHIFVKR